MKPFDLEAAKRGDPIITRDGREVKFIAYVPEAKKSDQVIVWDHRDITCHYDDGRFSRYDTSDRDLYMAPKKRTVWVNFYPSVDNEPPLAMTHKSQEKANRDGLSHRIGGKAYPVEIEG